MSNNRLIPELRFPVFKNEGEWDSKPLDDLCELITKGTTPTTLGYSYTESGVNFIKIESILEGNINLEKAAFISIECNEALKRSQLKEDDVLFSIAGALGVVTTVTTEILPANTNQALSIVRLKNKEQKDYVKAFLKSNLISAEVQKIKAGAAQPNISLNQVASFKILIPKNPKEQQKIASCLSSLDEVIVAQSQKLDLLKDHKKGLMQNLFPQEGEKVPKYRFKEFEGDGDWVEKTIEEIAKVTTGNKDTQNKVEDGLYPFFVRSQTVERINSYSFEGEAILTSGDGVGVGKNFHYIIGKFDFHQRVYCIYDFKNDICGQFVYMYFSQHFNERVMKMSAKNSVDSVRMAMITEMPIGLPSKKEQQRIASCLSSLDALITAQAEKIEQLKLHKKGLMQGLFPKVND